MILSLIIFWPKIITVLVVRLISQPNAGGQGYAKSTLGAGENLRIGGIDTSYGFYSVVSLGTSYSCIVQLKWQKLTIYNEATDITKDLTIAMDGNLAFTITNNRSVNTTVVVRRL